MNGKAVLLRNHRRWKLLTERLPDTGKLLAQLVPLQIPDGVQGGREEMHDVCSLRGFQWCELLADNRLKIACKSLEIALAGGQGTVARLERQCRALPFHCLGQKSQQDTLRSVWPRRRRRNQRPGLELDWLPLPDERHTRRILPIASRPGNEKEASVGQPAEVLDLILTRRGRPGWSMLGRLRPKHCPRPPAPFPRASVPRAPPTDGCRSRSTPRRARPWCVAAGQELRSEASPRGLVPRPRAAS